MQAGGLRQSAVLVQATREQVVGPKAVDVEQEGVGDFERGQLGFERGGLRPESGLTRTLQCPSSIAASERRNRFIKMSVSMRWPAPEVGLSRNERLTLWQRASACSWRNRSLAGEEAEAVVVLPR